MERIRLVHYLNQFFAGVGGEKQADLPPAVRLGPVGPGVPLQAALQGEGEIVATVYCGDDHVNANGDQAIHAILELVAVHKPDVVVAGPAFASGRYGVACGAVAQAVEDRLGIPAMTAMAPENPAVELYRRSVPIIPTGASPATMREIVVSMARLALKRGRGEPLGSPEEDGYLPRGIRKNVLETRPAAERVIDLLLAKLRGEPCRTEIPFPQVEPLVPAPPLPDVRTATIALVTSGGVVPRGNPDRIEARRASRWSRFSIAGLDDLTADDFECVHGGFDHDLVAEDPDRALPVDAMRELERERKIGRIYEHCYATVGAGAPIERARHFGREIAEELRAAGVQGVILTATWGTCNRCGATMAREMERLGLPTVVFSAIPAIPLAFGAPRIMAARAIRYPLGNPDLPRDRERQLRRAMVEAALGVLQAPCDRPTLFPIPS